MRVFTGKKHEGTFWNDRNVRYLDLFDSYTDIYIYEPGDLKTTSKFNEKDTQNSAYGHTIIYYIKNNAK